MYDCANRTAESCGSISYGKIKYNVTHDEMITKEMGEPFQRRPSMYCDCDELIKTCFRDTSFQFADVSESIYYRIFASTRCLKEEYPIVKCIEYEDGLCIRYELDETKSKIYQSFDLQRYRRTSFRTLPEWFQEELRCKYLDVCDEFNRYRFEWKQ